MKKLRWLILPLILVMVGYSFFFSAPVAFFRQYKGTDRVVLWEGKWTLGREETPMASKLPQEPDGETEGTVTSITVYRYREEEKEYISFGRLYKRWNGHRIQVECSFPEGKPGEGVHCYIEQWLDGKWYRTLPDGLRYYSYGNDLYAPEYGITLADLSHQSLGFDYEERKEYLVETGVPFYGRFRAVVTAAAAEGEKLLASREFYLFPWTDCPDYPPVLQN